MPNLLLVLLTALSTLFKTSTTLRFENLALRQQLGGPASFLAQAPSPHGIRSAFLGMAHARVDGLAIRPDDRPAGDRRRVAP
jgi:hypothetical protein